MRNCKTCKYRLMAEFKPPTVKEVEEYSKSINYKGLDSEYFIAQHERTGWVTKDGIPIRDWKAEVRLWMMAAFRRGEIKEDGPTWKEKYEQI